MATRSGISSSPNVIFASLLFVVVVVGEGVVFVVAFECPRRTIDLYWLVWICK